MKKTLVLALMVMSVFSIGARGCEIVIDDEKSCFVKSVDDFVDCYCKYNEDLLGGYSDFLECIGDHASAMKVCAPEGSCVEEYADCWYDYIQDVLGSSCWEDLDYCTGWFDSDCPSDCGYDFARCYDDFDKFNECCDEYRRCWHGCYE